MQSYFAIFLSTEFVIRVGVGLAYENCLNSWSAAQHFFVSSLRNTNYGWETLHMNGVSILTNSPVIQSQKIKDPIKQESTPQMRVLSCYKKAVLFLLNMDC